MLIGLPACAALILLGMVFTASVRFVDRPFAGFLFWDNGSLVSFHQQSWTGPLSKLRLTGGRILEVDGEPFRDGGWLVDRIGELKPGTEVRYLILEDGVTEEFFVQTMSLSPGAYFATFGVYLFNGAIFLLIAAIAVLLRPEQAAARALALASFCMGLLLTLAIDYFSAYRFVPVCLLVEGATPAALWYFTLSFPIERFSTKVRRGIGAILAAGGLALGFWNLTVYYQDPELSHSITFSIYALVSLAGLAMVVSFAESLFRSRSPRTRIQASFVFAGGLVGLVIPALLQLVVILFGRSISSSVVAVLLPILPLSILYAIVRHDLFQVERFIRLATGYTLATTAVVTSYSIGVLLLGRAIGRAQPDLLFSVLLIAGIIVGFDPLRRRLQALVDRAFYRTQVDAAAVLEETGATLVKLSDESAIREFIERRCSESLNVEWARFEPVGGELEEPALREPVIFQGQERGVLGCGAKRSGAPFSPVERELLKGLATQMALALETARSIEELRQAQRTLIRHERLAAIGEFAASLAHGLRNPLSGIRATAQTALDEDTDTKDLLRSVLNESDRLEQRIQGLLDFSRPFEPTIRSVELGQVVRDVVKRIERRAEREQIALVLEVPDDPLLAESDPDYLEEAILELVGNALRVTSSGDEIRLSLEALPNDSARIRVRDTGPGIPVGVQSRIFDLFFSTRPEGSGLGLGTVRKIIERLGGSFELESSDATGTTFRIDLRRTGV